MVTNNTMYSFRRHDICLIFFYLGKNVFYLPKGTDYTAIMAPSTDTDPKKRAEKTKINEQLILECIGKANIQGVGIKGRIRSKSQEIVPKSVDCVVSVGAISRSSAPVETVNEAFRMLRPGSPIHNSISVYAINPKCIIIYDQPLNPMQIPGGLFVFVESDGSNDTIEKILRIFPEKIIGGDSAGQKAVKAAAKAQVAPLSLPLCLSLRERESLLR